MTTTEQRLAAALRACVRDLSIAAEYTKTGNPSAFLETCQAARQAIAAYDAQQAQPALPVEWRSESLRLPQGYSRIYDGGRFVACVTDEDATRIVQCVNAHDGLVSALQGVLVCDERYRPNMGREWNHPSYGDALDALAAAGVQS
jgi:hypothetical protein